MSRILDKVRVLDFGQFIAGPYCGALLAGYGADVVRIERPEGNSDRFLVPLDGAASSGGALFQQVNQNKRSLSLDIRAPAAADVIRDMIESADVVIANFPDRALKAMGLDYASLASIKPDIILCSCNAYGGEGDQANLLGFDGIGQAISGAMAMSGDAGQPRKSFVHFVDYATACLSAFGVVVALMNRASTGEGEHVRLSLLHTALTMMNTTLIEEAVTGVGRTGTGNRAQLAGPADTFATSDGFLLVQVVGGAMFRRLARLLGREEWLDDPRFATDEARGAHGDILSAVMAEWCADKTTEACARALAEVGLPSAPVLAPADVLDHPLVRNGQFFPSESGVGGPPPTAGMPIARPPVSFRTVRPAPGKPAPAIGQHSREILTELGYDDCRIKDLIDAGVVYDRPGAETA